MRLLKRFDGWGRDGSHRFVRFLEYRLAPLTLIALLAVLAGAVLSWDSWRGEESTGTAIRNLVLIMAAIAALPLALCAARWPNIKLPRHDASPKQRSEAC